ERIRWAEQHFLDQLAIALALRGLFIKAFAGRRVAALPLADGQLAGQDGAILEDAHRRPQSGFQSFRLVLPQLLPIIRVTDVAAEAEQFLLIDLPERAATLRAREQRRLSPPLVAYLGLLVVGHGFRKLVHRVSHGGAP